MTSTWLRCRPEGLISTGFIAASGSMPHAAACIACARPISAPDAVTVELSAMFWALNGATARPWRVSHRHNAAVITVLPASDAVPAIRMLIPAPGSETRRRDARGGAAPRPRDARGGAAPWRRDARAGAAPWRRDPRGGAAPWRRDARGG